MKTAKKIVALALGSLLTLTLFAGCGSSDNDPTAARICFDNLNTGYIAAVDTTYVLEGVESMTAVDKAGNAVNASTVATYENGAFKAVSEGVITCTLKGGKKFRLEVVPAYVTDPHNQYASEYAGAANSKLIAGCHDPSLIEVEENGAPAYYIFSTGWDHGNEIRKSKDLVSWELVGKSMSARTKMDDIEQWIGSKNNGGISWWAPDIVPAEGGGYWLYTCCVGSKTIDGKKYSMGCITLFHSATLEKESFEYKGVLMQSVIPDGSDGLIDINSIDPQIIYSPDGKMYMAYGSFGTGNWMLELNPKTGLRKDGVYSDGKFLPYEEIREYRDEVVSGSKTQTIYTEFTRGEEITHSFYGTMISYGAEEAPVIARHDNVKIGDETATYDGNGELMSGNGKTYYYSMHSYNPLDSGYQMWGGRSESVWGKYLSVNDGYIMNYGASSSSNGGNKYTGSFTWADKSAGNTSIDVIYPGHNDLFTNSAGLNVAAYITRTRSYGDIVHFFTQIHQYYLNSMGDIVINPNRYGGEIDRSVSAKELFACTDGGKFKMVALANDNAIKTSEEVVLTQNTDDENSGKILQGGAEKGTWQMYGKGYIKFTFTMPVGMSRERIYYGIVRPAWLDDQNEVSPKVWTKNLIKLFESEFGIVSDSFSVL